MRKFIDFEDGVSWELSPLTYEEFDRIGKWTGESDSCFSLWLRHNNFYELDQLSRFSNPPDKKGLRIESGEPIIDWNYYDIGDMWQLKG